jgi:hypothetical protein
MVRRVTLITTLTAVLSPVTGVLLLWLGKRFLLDIQPQSISILEQLDLLRVFIIYALFFTGPLALVVAVLGASTLFALAIQGMSCRVLLLTGSVLGAVAGPAVLPPPGQHLVDLVRGGSPTNPYAVVGLINGAMWGLAVAGYAFRSSRPRGLQEVGRQPADTPRTKVES